MYVILVVFRHVLVHDSLSLACMLTKKRICVIERCFSWLREVAICTYPYFHNESCLSLFQIPKLRLGAPFWFVFIKNTPLKN